MARKRSPAAERHAELIQIALLEAAPSGLPFKRLMGACELSEYQTRSGLTALRDLAGGGGGGGGARGGGAGRRGGGPGRAGDRGRGRE
ncbi:hypothetical protein LCE31_36075, partial [Streptomyces sp. 8L]|nr:hypothetical protein [Streptomyces sp. 8L]